MIESLLKVDPGDRHQSPKMSRLFFITDSVTLYLADGTNVEFSGIGTTKSGHGHISLFIDKKLSITLILTLFIFQK
jgi:hypothetical protein